MDTAKGGVQAGISARKHRKDMQGHEQTQANQKAAAAEAKRTNDMNEKLMARFSGGNAAENNTSLGSSDGGSPKKRK